MHITRLGWQFRGLSYYELRNEMLDYLDNEKIAIENVGCQFPNLAERQYIDLRIGDTSHFSKSKFHRMNTFYIQIYIMIL